MCLFNHCHCATFFPRDEEPLSAALDLKEISAAQREPPLHSALEITGLMRRSRDAQTLTAAGVRASIPLARPPLVVIG